MPIKHGKRQCSANRRLVEPKGTLSGVQRRTAPSNDAVGESSSEASIRDNRKVDYHFRRFYDRSRKISVFAVFKNMERIWRIMESYSRKNRTL